MKNKQPSNSSSTVQKVLSGVLFFFAGVLSLGQLQRFQISGNLAIYLHDLIILQVITIGIVANAEYRQQLQKFLSRRSLIEKALTGVILIGWVISSFFGNSLLQPVLYSLRLAIYALFAHLLFFLTQKKILKSSSVSLAFLFFGISIAFFGILQYLFIPDTRFLFFLGWDDHYYRVISTLLDPGFTGLVLVMTIWLLQSVIARINGKQTQWISTLCTGLCFVALLLTYSRASYLAFGVTGVFFIFFQALQKKVKTALLWIVIAVLFIATIPFLPRPGGEGVKLERTVSTTARLSTAQNYLQNIKGYEWVIGNGLFVSQKGSASSEFPDHAQVADSWPIFILSGTGVVGLGLFLILLAQKGWWLFKANKALFLMLVAILVHGVFNASLVYPFVVLFFLGSVVGEVTQKT